MSQKLPIITPHIVVNGAQKAIAFYQAALGAVEICRMASMAPGDERLMHAELKIGDSKLYLCDAFPEMGGQAAPTGPTSVTISIEVENADQAMEKVVQAGGTVTLPVTDMFWGERYGKFTDPFGHSWAISQVTEVLTPEEMVKRGEEHMSKNHG